MKTRNQSSRLPALHSASRSSAKNSSACERAKYQRRKVGLSDPIRYVKSKVTTRLSEAIQNTIFGDFKRLRGDHQPYLMRHKYDFIQYSLKSGSIQNAFDLGLLLPRVTLTKKATFKAPLTALENSANIGNTVNPSVLPPAAPDITREHSALPVEPTTCTESNVVLKPSVSFNPETPLLRNDLSASDEELFTGLIFDEDPNTIYVPLFTTPNEVLAETHLENPLVEMDQTNRVAQESVRLNPLGAQYYLKIVQDHTGSVIASSFCEPVDIPQKTSLELLQHTQSLKNQDSLTLNSLDRPLQKGPMEESQLSNQVLITSSAECQNTQITAEITSGVENVEPATKQTREEYSEDVPDLVGLNPSNALQDCGIVLQEDSDSEMPSLLNESIYNLPEEIFDWVQKLPSVGSEKSDTLIHASYNVTQPDTSIPKDVLLTSCNFQSNESSEILQLPAEQHRNLFEEPNIILETTNHIFNEPKSLIQDKSLNEVQQLNKTRNSGEQSPLKPSEIADYDITFGGNSSPSNGLFQNYLDSEINFENEVNIESSTNLSAIQASQEPFQSNANNSHPITAIVVDHCAT